MSQAERQLIKEKYRIAYANPFRTQPIADPAILRYEAARAYMKETYKITPRSIFLPISIFGLIVAAQLMFNKQRDEKERKIATGESTYFSRALYKTKWLD
jgi:hypothetical protein